MATLDEIHASIRAAHNADSAILPDGSAHYFIGGEMFTLSPAEVDTLLQEHGAEAQNTRDLTPPEFEWLLAYTGLEDIWTGLEQNFKGPDRAKYAFLRGTRKKAFFNLATTLTLVAQFRDAAASIDPNVDLSDSAITAAWALATQSGV